MTTAADPGSEPKRKPSSTSTSPSASTLAIPARLMRPARRRRWLWIVGVPVAVALAWVGWRALGHEEAPLYRTEVLARRTISREVDAQGHLDVPERIEVPAPSPGRLARILVKPGESVQSGQVLAELDAVATAMAVGAARRSLEASDSRVAEAEVALAAAGEAAARTARLAERGLASAADLEAARAAERRGKAAVRSARAERAVVSSAVAAASLQRDLTVIRAPSGGVILAAPERLGAAVSPETPRLFVLGSTLDVLRVEAAVAEADVADVAPGQSARFTVPAFPGRVFAARVVRVDPDAQRERSSVTYVVRLETVNRPRLLFPGMTASVHIDVSRVPDTLAVREAALRFVPPRAELAGELPVRSRIWRLRPGARTPEAVSVTAGLTDGAYTEIRPAPGTELRVGDAIVIGLFASEGQKSGGPGVSLGRR
jgi:HlyD family secretion protein